MQAEIMEGRTEDILIRLRETYAGQNLRVTVEPREDYLVEGLSQAVRSKEHLISLLREGLHSPVQEVTEKDWEQRHKQIRVDAAEKP